MKNKHFRILATNALLAATLATTLTAFAGCSVKRSAIQLPTSGDRARVTAMAAVETTTATASQAVEQIGRIKDIDFDITTESALE